MIKGSLVFDAGALGLHWIYNHETLKTINTQQSGAVEFMNPVNYPGEYYAHKYKKSGDLSQYGEVLMLQHRFERKNRFASEETPYNVRFEKEFIEYFGFGGPYVGYVDSVMKGLMMNILTTESEAQKALDRVEYFKDKPDDLNFLKTKLVSSNRRAKNLDELREFFKFAMDATHSGNEEFQKAGMEMLQVFIQMLVKNKGVEDTQLCGLIRLPAIIGALLEEGVSDEKEIQDAILRGLRLTHLSGNIDHYALCYGFILFDISSGKDLFDSIKNRVNQIKDEKISQVLKKAIEMPLDRSVVEVQIELGVSCLAPYAFPGIIYSLRKFLEGKQKVTDVKQLYLDMIRTNILCGGDSCGRGVVLGAILGALYEVPDDLLSRVNSEFVKQLNS
jgi:ADP-ribosylglycohydrolase